MFRLPSFRAGTGKPVTLITFAYWVALLIIAVMLAGSFMLLQQMLAAQQRNERIIGLAGAQRALSQRVVFLANAAGTAPAIRQAQLVEALGQATAEFEANYDDLLDQLDADPFSKARNDPATVDSVLFSAPYHLDYFSGSLAANGWRVASALKTELHPNAGVVGYLAGKERAKLDDVVATATMDGYAALGERLSATGRERLSALLHLHRILFFATLAVMLLIAVFIFRPMAGMIGRRTDQLVEARNAMAYNAIHDELTGLYNRSFLKYRFDKFIENAAARGGGMAVIQFDLDRFKQINDTLGHAAGDHVLAITATRMREASRKRDIAVRLGGDEFVLVSNRCDDDGEIAALAESVLRAINRPIDYEGTTISPGASAGIAVYPRDGERGSDLLMHADVALYSAKKSGGGTFSFFTDDLRREIAARLDIEQQMVLAIASQDFTVCFQPQVSLSDGRVTGLEALVRWLPPDGKFIPPSVFVPIAEKCGLMPAIGRIVFRKAIAAAADWHREGLEFGRLALNASSSELAQPDFAGFLFKTLKAEGLPPQRLALEIVESVMLDDEKTGIAATLRTVRKEGIALELDDFGTGYASLTHVDPREIDRLKIDRRFVHNIDSNSHHAQIVRAVTDLARGLGIGIIAEGAETETELSLLAGIGCDQVQGYAVSFPMPSDNMREWLATRKVGNRNTVPTEEPEASRNQAA
ncbi:putative bifunctional diguanylate cyclase/phosphodiesterase [Aquibium oceanicum]|uniref:GGDEF-domain containing protein n=1 Tax=Aquibium oceanicum TaxID=1670800 RepID=A0A1L3SUV7_9HYPH|nr:EAL domain-containing protein [Aquibium oceanicum]APH73217.1 GGDEF-domain containing protein [Aquibium oceanicum]